MRISDWSSDVCASDLFAVQAAAGADLTLLFATIGIENLSGGMGSAAFVAYLSVLCNVAYTATQYALFSSFMAFGRTLLSSSSGSIGRAPRRERVWQIV